ncbi:MAG: iron-containing alcohol dehydrogenase [Desulfobacterales bacterium]|nr:MAG: iron-containing alcohol dehydrogenase [Desulfobacterales bacterium]
MDALMKQARDLILAFKGDRYAFGAGVLDQVGPLTAQIGRRALLVSRLSSPWLQPALERVQDALTKNGIQILGPVQGAAPNAPREDVYRLQGHILHKKPDVIVSLESGSGIDACKAAATLATFGDTDAELDPYFGVGEVTRRSQRTGRQVLPLVAVMTAASSSAHLTKYANITDPVKGQKKLIIDEAIVPPRAVFDYELTLTQPMSLSLDGGMDGFSHCLEVYLGAKGDTVPTIENITLLGIELIVAGLAVLAQKPAHLGAREQVALGTDLGGYAIMVGGTSGPHLNSFSLVNYLSHGRACALMNPYYTVFFTPAVEERVRKLGAIFQKHGYLDQDPAALGARELGRSVAEGILAFNRRIGFPTTLAEIEDMERDVLAKILQAAKDPQLESKLQNMPVPLNAELVDKYMAPILEAAWSGDLDKIVLR